MTTLLAHIEIKPGREAQFEDIMKDMVQKTLSEEDGVLRYEYFKGQQDNFYYCLLAFRISGRFTRTKTPLTTRGTISALCFNRSGWSTLTQSKAPARCRKRWTRPSIATHQQTWSKRAKSIRLASQAGGVKGCNLTRAGNPSDTSTDTLFLATRIMSQASICMNLALLRAPKKRHRLITS